MQPASKCSVFLEPFNVLDNTLRGDWEMKAFSYQYLVWMRQTLTSPLFSPHRSLCLAPSCWPQGYIPHSSGWVAKQLVNRSINQPIRLYVHPFVHPSIHHWLLIGYLNCKALWVNAICCSIVCILSIFWPVPFSHSEQYSWGLKVKCGRKLLKFRPKMTKIMLTTDVCMQTNKHCDPPCLTATLMLKLLKWVQYSVCRWIQDNSKLPLKVFVDQTASVLFEYGSKSWCSLSPCWCVSVKSNVGDPPGELVLHYGSFGPPVEEPALPTVILPLWTLPAVWNLLRGE